MESQPPDGPGAVGLDFTSAMRRLCAALVRDLPELGHIDLARVAIRFCQARQGGPYGVQASLTPLRFADGQTVRRRRGRAWTIQRLLDRQGREMLYLLSFYLPRFLQYPLEEKLAVVVHELWHISPLFNGDIRRLPHRCFAHGPRAESFHAAQRELAAQWLAGRPAPELYDFLQGDYAALSQKYGRIYGDRIPTPRLIPLPAEA